jgi:plastocyanin
LADGGLKDSFGISLSDPSGLAIRNLAAGSYPVVVNDESNIHNFHLLGTGVDKATSVGSTGKQTFTVSFSPGTYNFRCDTHPTQMHGSFTVS